MPLLKQSYCNQFTDDETTLAVISKLDASLDQDANLAIILSTQTKKDGLKQIVNFLKNTFSETYPNATEVLNNLKYNVTKTNLSTQIVNFVKVTYPHLCLKCKTDYLPLSPENSANSEVKCFACKLPAHAACVKIEDINLDQGFVQLCQTCLEKAGKNIVDASVQQELQPNTEVEKSEESASDHDSSESSEDSDEVKAESSWIEQRKKERKKKSSKKSSKKDQDCPLLIEGKCPHGLTGAKCDYKHRRQCHRYRSFGTKDMHRAGCHFGDKCNFLHPKLCQNSVKMKMCLNDSCTFVHLKYTKRIQPTEESMPRNNFRNGNNRSSNNNNNINTNYHQSSNSVHTGVHTDRSQPARFNTYNKNIQQYSAEQSYENPQNHSFLEKAMERMRIELSKIIHQQIETQFQQLQNKNYYEAEYPNLESQGHQGGHW